MRICGVKLDSTKIIFFNTTDYFIRRAPWIHDGIRTSNAYQPPFGFDNLRGYVSVGHIVGPLVRRQRTIPVTGKNATYG